MIRLKGSGLGEPEVGNLREHLALARDTVGHDAIEGRDAVGGDKQEAVAQIKNFADLAAFQFADARQFKRQKWFVQHEQNMEVKVSGLKFKVARGDSNCVLRVA